MLAGFSVENFKSFKERAILKMFASKGRMHKNHCVEFKDKKVLKTAMIFGANASGKTNLIDAMAFSKNIIINGIYEPINGNYFKINDEAINAPGIFDFDIIIDNKEYSYGIAVSYEKGVILSEWLYLIKKFGSDECIYDRNLEKDNRYSIKNDKKYNDIRKRCYDAFEGNVTIELSKKTILSDIVERNRSNNKELQDIINVYMWFSKKLFILYPASKYLGINSTNNNNLSEIVEFDTGIEKIEHSTIVNTLDNLFDENQYNEDMLRKNIMKKISLSGSYPFKLLDGSTVILHNEENGKVSYNKTEFDHGNSNNLFQYSDESDGTKRLLDLLPFYNLDEDATIVVDEIDRSLHTILLREFLNRFYNKCDKQSKQLIMTTHDTNIMDLNILRQDEIWFAERDNNHKSSLYSLSKYKVHFDTVVERNYLMGRYGGLPIIEQVVTKEVDNE